VPRLAANHLISNTLNLRDAITFKAGHLFQFNVCFTNTGPGTSYDMACHLTDCGSNGITQGTNTINFSTLQAITGTNAALVSDNSVGSGTNA
jgi:hypothetical protein